jgi:predicted transcriptional regulator
LTHHARVLLEIARHPQTRLRDIAAVIGITEPCGNPLEP